MAVWLIALAAGGAMIAAGFVYHPSLIVGGSVIAGTALLQSLASIWRRDV